MLKKTYELAECTDQNLINEAVSVLVILLWNQLTSGRYSVYIWGHHMSQTLNELSFE